MMNYSNIDIEALNNSFDKYINDENRPMAFETAYGYMIFKMGRKNVNVQCISKNFWANDKLNAQVKYLLNERYNDCLAVAISNKKIAA